MFLFSKWPKLASDLVCFKDILVSLNQEIDIDTKKRARNLQKKLDGVGPVDNIPSTN